MQRQGYGFEKVNGFHVFFMRLDQRKVRLENFNIYFDFSELSVAFHPISLVINMSATLLVTLTANYCDNCPMK